MSLRRRLYLLGAVGILPLLGVGAWNEASNRALRETELRSNLVQDAALVAQEFQRQLEAHKAYCRHYPCYRC